VLISDIGGLNALRDEKLAVGKKAVGKGSTLRIPDSSKKVIRIKTWFLPHLQITGDILRAIFD
jgi:hypothetical protein